MDTYGIDDIYVADEQMTDGSCLADVGCGC